MKNIFDLIKYIYRIKQIEKNRERLEKRKNEGFLFLLTFECSITCGGEIIGYFYYHLYENKFKKRKCECVLDDTSERMTESRKEHLLEKKFTTSVYLQDILPWLSGRYNAKIPSYSDAIQNDFIEHLKK